jgi:hypothetical protein
MPVPKDIPGMPVSIFETVRQLTFKLLLRGGNDYGHSENPNPP